MKKILVLFLVTTCLSLPAQTEEKNETLYKAVISNDRGYIMRLIGEGADVNYVATPQKGVSTTPLVTAVDNGNIDVSKLLIENKANVNWKDHAQKSALMHAASKGSKDIVVLLLDNGADINTTDGKGNTVLTEARKSGNKDLVKFIEGRLKAPKQ